MGKALGTAKGQGHSVMVTTVRPVGSSLEVILDVVHTAAWLHLVRVHTHVATPVSTAWHTPPSIEVVFTVAFVALKRTGRVDGLDEEVVGTQVVACNKLLCTCEDSLVEDMGDGTLLAAGLIVAAIWEIVDVATRLSHAET
eukprot:GHVL01008880.1.p2 GENE.GHVL01008880.1~~GHVL01008880.1.p2  ORF type:complete len:141 (-),score=13.53 GHVL01008880.1:785-1207(-)